MWHIGIDLHRMTVVLAGVNDAGEAMNPITIPCSDTATIANAVKALGTFRAVIEATGTYRWLYDLLRPLPERACVVKGGLCGFYRLGRIAFLVCLQIVHAAHGLWAFMCLAIG